MEISKVSSGSSPTDPACDPTVDPSIQNFQRKYFQDSHFDLQNTLHQLFALVSQFWFFGAGQDVPWDPKVYFLDFSALVASGASGNALESDVYVHQVLRQLIAVYDGRSDAKDLVTSLQTLNTRSDLGSLLKFPEIININTSSITLKIYVSFGGSCPDQLTDFQTNVEDGLKHFYQDESGSYVDGEHPTPQFLLKPELVKITSVEDYTVDLGDTSATIGNVITGEFKMSFMMMLRYFVKYPKTQAFETMGPNQFQNLVVEGMPVPVCIDPAAPCANDLGCTSNDTTCHCLYFCSFGAFECPGYSYYYCQFFDRCKCIVTRAVPLKTKLTDRINNKFGQCFDLNCADQTSKPSDCASMCNQAREWLNDPNWYVNFINPAAVNVDLIEKTCGFKVPQFSDQVNTYFWSWKIILGGLCALAAVPVLVGYESWAKEKFSLRFIHIALFLVLATVVVIFGYMLAGVQICEDFGDPVQSLCLDRLTKSLPLNHADCDVQNPIFCQCNASTNNQRPCTALALPNCTCQNNQMCTPNASSTDNMLEPSPPTRKAVQWQLLYLCVGIYLLVAVLAGLAIHYATHPKGILNMAVAPNVALHLGVYLGLAALIVVFPVVWKYQKEWDQTLEINTKTQGQLCSTT